MSDTRVVLHPAQAKQLTATFRQLFATDVQCLAFCEMCVGKWYDLGPDEEPTYIHARAAYLSKNVYRQFGEFRETTRTATRVSKLITIAESTAKFAFGFAGKGKSAAYARRFFLELCPSPCAALLKYAVRNEKLSDAFDRLYEIRNLSLHRGHNDTSLDLDQRIIRVTRRATGLGALLRAKLEGHDSPTEEVPALQGPTIFEALQHLIVSGCHAAISRSLDSDCAAQVCPGHARFVATVCCGTACQFLEHAKALAHQNPGQSGQSEV